MNPRLLVVMLAAITLGQASAQQPATGSFTREWSNTEGRKITAEYLGLRNDSVMIRMADGKIATIPLAKLSDADNVFVRDNPMSYQEPWKAWPSEVETAAPSVDVTETASGNGEFIYETPHFRFRVDGNLGAPLMKDLAQVFELTYSLHTKSPFGLLAKPEKDRFEAKLFGKKQTYLDQGGPPQSAGVYLPKKKAFLAPLDLMGVKVDGSVWRRIPRSRCDTSTVIHELTHMLTHDMLITLPTWMNEGYAEYISNIPIEGNAFRISPKKVREGVIDAFVLDYEKWNSTQGNRIAKIGPVERQKFLKEDLPQLPPVSAVLGITDEMWATTPSGSGLAFRSEKFSYDQKMGLYRTSHLIVYYFLHLDGEKGIAKLRRFVARKQQESVQLLAYTAAYDEYEKKMGAFLKLPGVKSLPDGKFSYPGKLTPPVAPTAPAGAAESTSNSGMELLLDGETPEALGTKIQQAVSNDLGLKPDFGMKITPKSPFGR